MTDRADGTPLSFELHLPGWAGDALASLPETMPTLEDRMREVIQFARLNVKHETGGPFAAGVFEEASGKLVAMGVNRVVPLECSVAHAEVMALSLAQHHLASWDLGAKTLPAHQLVVNWAPCAMCCGAVHWSGIRSLVVAGDVEELERVTGFDEGPVHPDWQHELERRGVRVIEGILHDEALALFREFADGDHPVYNARRNG